MMGMLQREILYSSSSLSMIFFYHFSQQNKRSCFETIFFLLWTKRHGRFQIANCRPWFLDGLLQTMLLFLYHDEVRRCTGFHLHLQLSRSLAHLKYIYTKKQQWVFIEFKIYDEYMTHIDFQRPTTCSSSIFIINCCLTHVPPRFKFQFSCWRIK